MIKNIEHERDKNRNIKASSISAVLTMIWFLTNAMSKMMYANVDNFNISLVTNGLFGTEAYTYYIHPWLCYFVNILSKIFTSSDMYVLLMHSLLTLSLWAIFYMIVQSDLKKCDKILFVLIIFVLTFVISLYNCNFTIHASLFAITGAELWC